MTPKKDAAERQRRRRARVKAARAGDDAPGWARLRQPGRTRSGMPRVRLTGDQGSDWALSEGIRQAIRDGLQSGTVHPAAAARGFRDLQTANAGAYMSWPQVEQALHKVSHAAIVAILKWTHPQHIGTALDYLSTAFDSDLPDIPEKIEFSVRCPECEKTSKRMPADPISTIIDAAARHVHSSRRDQLVDDIRKAVEKL